LTVRKWQPAEPSLVLEAQLERVRQQPAYVVHISLKPLRTRVVWVTTLVQLTIFLANVVVDATVVRKRNEQLY
jgi:hypothetical protein